MLKLNLLKGKDVPSAEEKQEIKESEFLSAEEFAPQEEKIELVEEESAAEEEQRSIETEPSESVEKTPETHKIKGAAVEEAGGEEEFTFEKKSKFPIIPVVALLTIVLLAFVYFELMSNKKGVTNRTKIALQDTTQKKSSQSAEKEKVSTPKQKSKTTQEKTAPVLSTQAVKPSSKNIRPGLANEKQIGFTAVNLFGKVLRAVPSGAKVAFLSFKSGYFTIELFARQKTLLNSFLKNAKTQVPSLSYKVVSDDRSFYGGTKMYHLIVSGQVALSGGTIVSGSVLSSQKAKASIYKLAKDDRVRVREIRKSPFVTDENGKHIPITVKITAQEEDVQKFISDLLNSYRNVGVSRILISASKPGASSRQDASLDLNLFFE